MYRRKFSIGAWVIILLLGIVYIHTYLFNIKSACVHYFWECCSDSQCTSNCYGIPKVIRNKTECENYCTNQSPRDYCCPDCLDHCQVDSECGSGCRCINSSSGNYCHCPTSTPTPTPTPTNHAPSCTISFPTDGGSSTITYDTEQYYDSNGGQVNDSATARSGCINTSDSDGDTVTITSVNVSNNCVAFHRTGNNFTLTPQGQINNVVPALSGTNSCVSRVTAYISDGTDSASCYRDFTTEYPATEVTSIRIYDRNTRSVSPDTPTSNYYVTTSFTTVGSSAPDAQTYQMNALNNAGTPQQTLPDVSSRFTSTGLNIHDHAPFLVQVR